MSVHLLLWLALGIPLAIGPSGQSPDTGTPAAGPVQVVAETRIDSLVRQLSAELRCPVCQGLSLQDSPSELSQGMRDVIREQLEAGKTPDEVKQFFVASYGEWILLAPEPKGFNLAVYFLPVLALVAGAIFLVVVARRWLRPAAGAGAPIPEADDPDLAPWEEIRRL